MKPTTLLYLTHMQQLTGSAEVLGVEPGEKTTVYLDQTIFYPQGGGQPFDMGVIEGAENKFIVNEVRFADGIVAHKGHFESGNFPAHFPVMLHVNEARRWLNSRLHTAGHVIDHAVDALKLGWEPTKAYHFPEGPYVEYKGTTDSAEFGNIQAKIQELCNHYIAENLPVSCRFASLEEVKQLCPNAPTNFWANLPPCPPELAELEGPDKRRLEGKPIRLVMVDMFAVPCGGTHVRSLVDLEAMVITKIKKKGDDIRVSYDVKR